ncbi:Protein CBG01407 [Caenorhabditis briggsae]|uniref:Protein CBG01407 n=1 Tax=Caenorhabditis briggsae TaxID=6238 RepID=A8WQC5_CAEBR|nr:Protein CBG01407 [Caenorhabditis briggsae]CAP22683.1 Protein CBG01407 [Caenorhabditis briggsae]
MTDSLLSSPEFVSRTFHFLTFITVPVNMLGAYCILFKTPKSMSSVKLVILNLHLCSMTLDIVFSVLIQPVVFFPAVAAYSNGVLKVFGKCAGIELYFAGTMFAVVSMSIVSVMENRFYLLFVINTLWRKIRPFVLFFNYFVACTFLIPLLLQAPNQIIAFEIIQKKFPDIPFSSYSDSLFIFSVDSSYVFLSVFLTGALTVSQINLYCFLIILNMRKLSSNGKMSQRTYHLQRRFLIAIGIQIFTPLIVLFVPATYLDFCFIFEYYNQAVNNICMILISFHGWVSAIVMMFIHEPYRKFCLNILDFQMYGKGTKPISVQSIVIH